MSKKRKRNRQLTDAELERRLEEFLNGPSSSAHTGVVERAPFPPEENGYFEVHWGLTPNGGDLSIGYFYDKFRRPCKEEDMAYMNIIEYLKDGTFVQSYAGAPPILSEEEWQEGQIMFAEAYAAQHKLTIVGKAIDENTDMYFHCTRAEGNRTVVLCVSRRETIEVCEVIDPVQRFKALKLIKGL